MLHYQRMKFNKTILSNGLRVITIPMTDNPSVTVLVMVETGSKYEVKKLNGISHFLEHMMFKGTPRRPKASDISRELDGIGAHYNAFTSQEYTGYYAKAASRHLDVLLDIISDMYLHPIFEKAEIEKEKGVIVEEIKMYKDMPQARVQEVFMELLYGDRPAGWSIAGTEENVKSFSRGDFVKYRDQHYVSGATTVIVSGSFDEKKCIAKIKKAYADMSSSMKKGKDVTIESQKSPQVKTFFKETDQTHLVIGVRTFPILNSRIPVMHVLSSVLGAGMSSRLFSRMRDQLGICYYIKTNHETFTDHGILNISAGVDNSRIEEAIKEILAQCKKLKNEPVLAAELKKAKDYIAGTTLLELETSEARAEYAGYQEVLKKKVESPDELIKKVQKVTAANVQKLAQEIFVDSGLNMAIVGKFKDGAVFKGYFRF